MDEYYILGDWGTSSARFYLCKNGEVIESLTGPGIKFTPNPAELYHETVRRWVNAHGDLKSLLSGMVGANIGWREAGYIDCPADAEALLEKKVTFTSPSGEIIIIPGVKTNQSLTGQADMMRGEEVQVFGWAYDHGHDGLLCLPGTHTKWTHFKDGKIDNFVSSLNGELFNILAEHSVLIGKNTSSAPTLNDAFKKGVEIGASSTSLNQLLFSVRSRQLNGDDAPEDSQSYLLGLLIGSDVSSGFNYAEGGPITVIGGEGPARFYAEAIRRLGGKVHIYDGQKSSIAGLGGLYDRIT